MLKKVLLSVLLFPVFLFAAKPVVLIKDTTICQNQGELELKKLILKPKTTFGLSVAWRVLTGPSAPNLSKMIYDKSMNNLDWYFTFGQPSEDFYAGTYTLELKVTDQLTAEYSMDTTTIEIVLEPKLGITSPPSVCESLDTLHLANYVTSNGLKPHVDGVNDWFYISDGPHANTKLTKDIFLPSWGAGQYVVRYTSTVSGCSNTDSLYVVVNSAPSAKLPKSFTICEGKIIDLTTKVVSLNPGGGQQWWSGAYVSNNQFTATPRGLSAIEGPYILKLIYTVTGAYCGDTQTLEAYVENENYLVFQNAKPTFQFESEPLELKVQEKYSTTLNFSLLKSSDGVFKDSAGKKYYIPGPKDLSNHGADIKVCPTSMAGCPKHCDSLHIQFIGAGLSKTKGTNHMVIPSVLYLEGNKTYFKPDLPALKEYRIRISDVSGRTVYSSSDAQDFWTFPSEGMYFYHMAGIKNSGENLVIKGKVLVEKR